jgi:hypothetical protein
MPTQSNGHNEIGTTVVSLERQGGWILVRDRTPGFQKRAGLSAQADDKGSEPHPADVGADPIYRAIAGNTSAPIMAIIPVVCDGPNNLVLVDITKLFSNDIETLSAKKQVAFAKMQVKSVDSARSFVKEVRAFPQNVSVKSQLTFLAVDPASATPEPIPVTVGIGHWFVTLPEPPMPARQFDERVGFFQSKFTEFRSSEGESFSKGGVIWRHRLEKADPSAAVSEPIKPIVFYVSREVPGTGGRMCGQASNYGGQLSSRGLSQCHYRATHRAQKRTQIGPLRTLGRTLCAGCRPRRPMP